MEEKKRRRNEDRELDEECRVMQVLLSKCRFKLKNGKIGEIDERSLDHGKCCLRASAGKV